jgi:hypothetical protein
MSFDPVFALAFNAGAQVLVSSLLGTFMLIPLQPWGRKLVGRIDMRSLLATHLDWLMLAFMQWGAAFIMSRWPHTRAPWIAALLIFGGWTNALPYLLRGFGINAFAMAGNAVQRISTGIAGLSVLAILVAWTTILLRMLALL